MSFIDKTRPESVPQLFAEAWNQYDAERLASLFAENAEFVNVTGLWWHSREAIFKAHDYGLKVIFNQSTLELLYTRVRYLSPEIAVVHARMRLTNQTPLEEGTKPLTRKNIFLFIVKKKDNEWICETAQNTEILDGKETFIRMTEGPAEATGYRILKNSGTSSPEDFQAEI